MEDIGDSSDGTLEDALRTLDSPRVRRRVWLDNARGERLGYAVSWWAAADVPRFLPDVHAAIGSSWAAQRLESFREILAVTRAGSHAALEAGLGLEAGAGALWGRWYLSWHGGRPVALIYEVFSPRLTRWLGPHAPHAGGGAPGARGEAEEGGGGVAEAAEGGLTLPAPS
jgi:chorismate lyase